MFEIGEDIGVQTGSGVILVKTLQLEGKKPVTATEFVRGNPGCLGTLLIS